MGNHLSAIGFKVDSYAEFENPLSQAPERGERLQTGSDAYIRWSPGAGVELWAQACESGGFGLDLRFAGEATIRVGLT